MIRGPLMPSLLATPSPHRRSTPCVLDAVRRTWVCLPGFHPAGGPGHSLPGCHFPSREESQPWKGSVSTEPCCLVDPVMGSKRSDLSHLTTASSGSFRSGACRTACMTSRTLTKPLWSTSDCLNSVLCGADSGNSYSAMMMTSVQQSLI